MSETFRGASAGESPGGVDDGDFDPATQPRQPDKSLGELFGEMSRDVSTLMRKEVELAKVEAKEEVAAAGKGVGMLVGAGVVGLMALTMFSFALAWLIDQALNRALSFALVGLLWVIVALVLVSAGKKNLKKVKPLPETVETLKEDVQWAKEQKS